MRFDWDDTKAETNLTKHSVSFQEAASVFDDTLSVAFPDPDHSIEEERLIQDNFVRIISAREVTRHEKRVYEEAL